MRPLATLLLAAIGLCAASLADGASTKARITVKPQLVHAGGTIVIVGHGFRPGVTVAVSVHRPRHGIATRLASSRTGPKGGFTFRKTLKRTMGLGTWVIRACQSGCAVKATAQFRIAAKIKPV